MRCRHDGILSAERRRPDFVAGRLAINRRIISTGARPLIASNIGQNLGCLSLQGSYFRGRMARPPCLEASPTYRRGAMSEVRPSPVFPYRHLLGIEGLSTRDI